jgi:hypothetical protein
VVAVGRSLLVAGTTRREERVHDLRKDPGGEWCATKICPCWREVFEEHCRVRRIRNDPELGPRDFAVQIKRCRVDRSRLYPLE